MLITDGVFHGVQEKGLGVRGGLEGVSNQRMMMAALD